MEPRRILYRLLTVVDVHGDFEAETKIIVAWFFPFHICNTSYLQMDYRCSWSFIIKLVEVYDA